MQFQIVTRTGKISVFSGRKRWTAFDDQFAPHLPPSESDFFSHAADSGTINQDDAFGGPESDTLSSVASRRDPFAPLEENLIQQVLCL